MINGQPDLSTGLQPMHVHREKHNFYACSLLVLPTIGQVKVNDLENTTVKGRLVTYTCSYCTAWVDFSVFYLLSGDISMHLHRKLNKIVWTLEILEPRGFLPSAASLAFKEILLHYIGF